METLLHTGIGHPNLLWILIAALVSFSLGMALGASIHDSDSSESTPRDDSVEKAP
jgi:hypothetical protein